MLAKIYLKHANYAAEDAVLTGCPERREFVVAAYCPKFTGMASITAKSLQYQGREGPVPSFSHIVPCDVFIARIIPSVSLAMGDLKVLSPWHA